MTELLTLIADVAGPVAVDVVPAGYTVREARPRDTDELGALYFAAYAPGMASASLAEAIEDIRTTFGGAYGELWDEASLVATAEGRIVSAILTVVRAPWDDTPRCPFVVEIFTDAAHRRRGLGRYLVRRCLAEVSEHESASALALRVRSSNRPALELYHSLGFRSW